MKAGATFLLTLLLAAGPAAGQTTGTILGRVTDGMTAEPLGGTLVRAVHLRRETITAPDGRFVLAGVTAGRQDLQFRLVGYKPVTLQGVSVPGGRAIEVEVRLEPTAIAVEPIVVDAERQPLIEPEVSESREILSGRELRELPVTAVREAIELTTGVSDGRFRGGRIGQETYVVDGIAIKNQLESSLQGPGIELSPTSLEALEVVTGGFGAEYGSALSGVVSYVTRRGNPERWEGAASVLSDQWAPSEIFTGFTGATVTVGGPLGFLGAGSTLFADLFLQGFRDADPRARGLTCLRPEDADPELAAEITALAADAATAHLHCPFERQALPNQEGDKLIGFLRLDRPISSGAMLTATLLRNRTQNELYTPEFKYNPRHQLGRRTTGNLGTLTLDLTSHREGRATHLTVRFAAQRLDRYLGVLDAETLEDRLEVAGFGFSDFEFLGEDFVRSPIEEQLDSGLAVPGYVEPQGSLGSPFGPAAEAIFVTEGTPGIANWSRSDFLGGDVVGEFLSASGTALRAGASGRFYEVESYERTRSFLPGSAPNFARFHPATLGGFAEVRLEPEEPIAVTLGVRVESFRSGLKLRRDRADFLAPVIDTDWKVSFMPRFGVAGAFRNSAGRSAFRFNFTRVAQPPDFQFFLDNTIGDSLRTDIRRQGNPNLAFEEGRSFELGFSHLFEDVVGVGLTLFRKELTDLVTGNVRFAGTQPGQFTTGDHGTVQGAELTVRTRWLWGELRAGYALQRATGITSGIGNDTTTIEAGQGVEFPLAFDRRHSVDLTFLAGRAAGGSRTGWGGVLTAMVQSGFPLDRRIVTDPVEGPPALERLPWTVSLDLRVTREIGSFPGCRSCRLRLVLDGRNILGRNNIIALRRDTGEIAPSLQTVNELVGTLPGSQPAIPRESPRYSPLADLDRDGRITADEFATARFAAALDRNDPSLLYGEATQVRLGVELSFR
ncbi:MAG: TonB-dependent receptor domain-containing protein [Gemmatimonadota bacterium]